MDVPFFKQASIKALCNLTPVPRCRMTAKWLVLVAGLAFSAYAEPYVYPGVHLHDLPGPLQEAYRNEKPNLGDIGRCVVSYDSSMDQEKMIFTCSIYVKMSAVAERKAMERCEQMKEKRGIKGPCRVIKE